MKRPTSLKFLEVEAEEISKNLTWIRDMINSGTQSAKSIRKFEEQFRAQKKRYQGILEKAKNYGKDSYKLVEFWVMGVAVFTVTYPGYVLDSEIPNLIKRDFSHLGEPTGSIKITPCVHGQTLIKRI